MEITDELIACYIDGTITEKERREVRLYIAQHPNEYGRILALMDRDRNDEDAMDVGVQLFYSPAMPNDCEEEECNDCEEEECNDCEDAELIRIDADKLCCNMMVMCDESPIEEVKDQEIHYCACSPIDDEEVDLSNETDAPKSFSNICACCGSIDKPINEIFSEDEFRCNIRKMGVDEDNEDETIKGSGDHGLLDRMRDMLNDIENSK